MTNQSSETSNQEDVSGSSRPEENTAQTLNITKNRCSFLLNRYPDAFTRQV